MKDFTELLEILSERLKLLTVADRVEGEDHYQLAHDFLVPSIRSWIAEQQSHGQTILEDRTRAWIASSKDKRHLPSLSEYALIRKSKKRAIWSKNQVAMMKAAWRRFLVWSACSVAAIVPAAFGIRVWWDSALDKRRLSAYEAIIACPAADVVSQITKARKGGFLPRERLRIAFSIADDVAGRLRPAAALFDEQDVYKKVIAEAVASGDEMGDELATILQQLFAVPATREVIGDYCKNNSDLNQPGTNRSTVALPLALSNPDALTEILTANSTSDQLRQSLLFGLRSMKNWSVDSEELFDAIRELKQSSDTLGVVQAANLLVDTAKPPKSDYSTWVQLRPAERKPWFRAVNGQTMVVLGPDEFTMGANRPTDARYEDEEIWYVDDTDQTATKSQVSRFAIAIYEVTVGNFDSWPWMSELDRKVGGKGRNCLACFVLSTTKPKMLRQLKYAPDFAQGYMNWDFAARYCNWLSEREAIPEDDWCFREVSRDGVPVMEVKPDFAKLTGYRMPTRAEWEYAARTCTTTRRHFGNSDATVGQYAWFYENSGLQVNAVGQKLPNLFGLHDTLGNVWEWCIDRPLHSEEMKAQRGGGYADPVYNVRPTAEGGDARHIPRHDYGLRIARSIIER